MSTKLKQIAYDNTIVNKLTATDGQGAIDELASRTASTRRVFVDISNSTDYTTLASDNPTGSVTYYHINSGSTGTPGNFIIDETQLGEGNTIFIVNANNLPFDVVCNAIIYDRSGTQGLASPFRVESLQTVQMEYSGYLRIQTLPEYGKSVNYQSSATLPVRRSNTLNYIADVSGATGDITLTIDSNMNVLNGFILYIRNTSAVNTTLDGTDYGIIFYGTDGIAQGSTVVLPGVLTPNDESKLYTFVYQDGGFYQIYPQVGGAPTSPVTQQLLDDSNTDLAPFDGSILALLNASTTPIANVSGSYTSGMIVSFFNNTASQYTVNFTNDNTCLLIDGSAPTSVTINQNKTRSFVNQGGMFIELLNTGTTGTGLGVYSESVDVSGPLNGIDGNYSSGTYYIAGDNVTLTASMTIPDNIMLTFVNASTTDFVLDAGVNGSVIHGANGEDIGQTFTIPASTTPQPIAYTFVSVWGYLNLIKGASSGGSSSPISQQDFSDVSSQSLTPFNGTVLAYLSASSLVANVDQTYTDGMVVSFYNASGLGDYTVNFSGVNGSLLMDGTSPTSITITDTKVRSFVNQGGTFVELLNTASSNPLFRDAQNETYSFNHPDGGVIQVNQEIFDIYTNLSGNSLVNGDIVSIVPASGNREGIALTDPTNADHFEAAIGMVTVPTILNNNKGRITKIGKVRELDTNGFIEGGAVYVDPANPGKYTQTRPTTGNIIRVGTCSVAHQTQGVIDVHIEKIAAGSSSVAIPSGTTNGQFLYWDVATSSYLLSSSLYDETSFSFSFNNGAGNISSITPVFASFNDSSGGAQIHSVGLALSKLDMFGFPTTQTITYANNGSTYTIAMPDTEGNVGQVLSKGSSSNFVRADTSSTLPTGTIDGQLLYRDTTLGTFKFTTQKALYDQTINSIGLETYDGTAKLKMDADGAHGFSALYDNGVDQYGVRLSADGLTAAATDFNSLQHTNVGFITPTSGNDLFFPDKSGTLATLDDITGGGGGVVAGNDKEIQFNDNGVFGADTNFKYDKSIRELSVSYVDSFVNMYTKITPGSIEMKDTLSDKGALLDVNYLRFTGSSNNDIYILPGDPTTARNLTLPDKDGTFATVDDITGVAAPVMYWRSSEMFGTFSSANNLNGNTKPKIVLLYDDNDTNTWVMEPGTYSGMGMLTFIGKPKSILPIILVADGATVDALPGFESVNVQFNGSSTSFYTHNGSKSQKVLWKHSKLENLAYAAYFVAMEYSTQSLDIELVGCEIKDQNTIGFFGGSDGTLNLKTISGCTYDASILQNGGTTNITYSLDSSKAFTNYGSTINYNALDGIVDVSAVTPTSDGVPGQRGYSGGYMYKCVATNTRVRNIVETTR